MYDVMLILYDYATPNTAFAIRGIKSKVKLEFANVILPYSSYRSDFKIL